MAEHGAEESGDVWEILSSKYVVKDRWLTLRADDCRNADGQVIAPYLTASLSQVTHLVTDRGASSESVRALRELGVELTVV